MWHLRIRIMVTFIGEYTCRLDDRGRLVLPAPLKSALPPGCDQRFVIKKSLYDPCLEMYTFEEWSRQSEKIKDSLDFFNPRHVLFWREYMRDRDIVEPDSKIGRITVDRNLLDAIGVNRDVVFFGTDFKIEIWAKEQFDAARIPNDEFVAIAESLSTK